MLIFQVYLCPNAVYTVVINDYAFQTGKIEAKKTCKNVKLK